MTSHRDAWDAASPEPLPPVEKPATVRRLGPVDAPSRSAGCRTRSGGARTIEGQPLLLLPPDAARRLPFRRRQPGPATLLLAAGLAAVEPVAAAADAPRDGGLRLRGAGLPKAMLARLEAGQRIDTHKDGGGSHPLVHKVHIPLQTEPEALLTVEGARIHLPAGYAWEVNNLAWHGAFNGGTRDRIHFIFEVFEGAGRDVLEIGSGDGRRPTARASMRPPARGSALHQPGCSSENGT